MQEEDRLIKKIKEIENKYKIIIGIYAVKYSNNFRKDKIIAINENAIFPAASLIKIYLALAVLYKIKDNKYTLEQKITYYKKDILLGNSIIADLDEKNFKIRDVLYYLLSHSDNTAQNMLEQIVDEKEINNFIKNLKIYRTKYVSLKKKDKDNISATTPRDMGILFEKIISRNILNNNLLSILLNFLNKSRIAYGGLRYLPNKLNTANNEIFKYHSKVGKLETSFNESLLLETKFGLLQFNILIKNFNIKKYKNNVDNKGMVILGRVALELFTFFKEKYEEI